MKWTTGTLFLVVTIFLDFIEFITSEEPPVATLAQLFPTYKEKGYLPPISKFPTEEYNKRQHLFNEGSFIFIRPKGLMYARGRVVFAWKGEPPLNGWPKTDVLEPLTRCFQGVNPRKRWVFDMLSERWLSLHENEFKKMGIGYHYALVRAQEEVSASTSESTYRPELDVLANSYAREVANHIMDGKQYELAELINTNHMHVNKAVKLIGTEYKKVFMEKFYEYTDEFEKNMRNKQHPSSSSSRNRY